MAGSTTRPVPIPTPESRHYWDGLAERRIRLQRCRPCDRAYFPPRSFCPRCGTEDVEIFEASGRATLYSFVVSQHRVPGFERPYVVGVAEFAEGPRTMTQIVGTAPTAEALTIDMELEPVFQDVEDGPTLLHFRPRAQGDVQ